MCSGNGNFCFSVNRKTKKVYYISEKDIKKMANDGDSVSVDSHSNIKDYFEVSNVDDWSYNIQSGTLECESGEPKTTKEAKQFVFRFFKNKTVKDIRKLEKVRETDYVDDTKEYASTRKRIKKSSDVSYEDEEDY